jgi:DNA-binding PadR family transcriptional regulator
MPAEAKPRDDKSPVSILELHILCLLDRGAETSYDFLQAGVSLGSSVPALRRIEAAGLVLATRSAEIGKRQRHSFSLTAKGRKLMVRGGAGLLTQAAPTDLDSVLRVLDIAHGINAAIPEIASFLNGAVQDRLSLAKSAVDRDGGQGDQLQFKVTRNRWDAARLKTEARFLSQIAKSLV